MVARTTKEEVLSHLAKFFGEEPQDHGHDNRGPDFIHKETGKRYYIETIAFSESNRGKNQSDFWKAFAQAVSRLNPSSIWGRPDYVVLALPGDFLPGWRQRVEIHGEDVWQRIGDAFPELEIWFISEGSIVRCSWNEAYHAAD